MGGTTCSGARRGGAIGVVGATDGGLKAAATSGFSLRTVRLCGKSSARLSQRLPQILN
jgi:hypothetical protein